MVSKTMLNSISVSTLTFSSSTFFSNLSTSFSSPSSFMLIPRVSGRDRGDDAVALTDADTEGDEGVVSSDLRNFTSSESGRSLCPDIANDGGRDAL